MSHKVMLNAGRVQLMVQFLQARQIALSQVFNSEQLALIAALTEQATPHIEVEQFAAMLRHLADTLNEPDIALQIASMVTSAHLGVLGYLLHACPTLGDAFLSLQRYGRLMINVTENFDVQQTGDLIVLRWQPKQAVDDIVWELSIAMMVQFARQLAAQPVAIHEVRFRRPQPEVVSSYQSYFACPVLFGQTHVSIAFSTSVLAVATTQPDRVLLGILRQQADLALQALPCEDEFLHHVRQQLIGLCQYGKPTLHALAASMMMSSRTLQRRLAGYQLSFQDILDQVRQQLCRQYLAQHVQLSDVAQLLGYSDQSAFTRAYKRWTGDTPHQQRIASRKNI